MTAPRRAAFAAVALCAMLLALGCDGETVRLELVHEVGPDGEHTLAGVSFCAPEGGGAIAIAGRFPRA